MTSGVIIFVLLVATAVFLLSQGLFVPTLGDSAKTRKRLRERLAEIDAQGEKPLASLLREKYLVGLTPLQKKLETLPGMDRLADLIEQGGHRILAHRLVLLSFGTALLGLISGWVSTRNGVVALVGLLVGLIAPFIKMSLDRKKRFETIEEQLPDAIDIVKRALRAGHPFATAIRLVAEDMDRPISDEFQTTFSDINYGNDVRRAMLGLLNRVPSVTVMALVTSVLVQRETGGNLAEILDQIAAVVRGRFRFYRRVRSLSAEGRMSAWVLTLVPFVLFVMIWFTQPQYLEIMLNSSTGRAVLTASGVMMLLGIYWMRRIIRIEV